MPAFDLTEHLAKEHKRTPFSQYLREIVYGGNDGIVTTFAVVAGFAGAAKDPATSTIPVVTVLLFGIANLFADGLSMSLGSFISLRADQDVYKSEKAREYHEIQHSAAKEAEETIVILKHKGFNTKDAKTITDLYRKNPSYWTEFMMKDELEMQSPEHEHPLFVAIATFLAFIVFGSIPLLPYLFHIKMQTFNLSITATALALLLLGALRGLVTSERPVRALIETVIVGGIAAATAYTVGTFFRI
jgi:VIT1/CCC1 family predicted Fe2+/Mn2+ transporter